jgi:hypothetical protein
VRMVARWQECCPGSKANLVENEAVGTPGLLQDGTAWSKQVARSGCSRPPRRRAGLGRIDGKGAARPGKAKERSAPGSRTCVCGSGRGKEWERIR